MRTVKMLAHEITAQVVVRIRDDAPDDLFTRVESAEFQGEVGPAVHDERSVLAYWAFRTIYNRVDDASQISGWSDLARGMVTFYYVPQSGPEITMLSDVAVSP